MSALCLHHCVPREHSETWSWSLQSPSKEKKFCLLPLQFLSRQDESLQISSLVAQGNSCFSKRDILIANYKSLGLIFLESTGLFFQTSKLDRFYSCYYCKTHSNQQDILEKHIEETHKTLTFKYEVVKEAVTKLECLYCSKVGFSSYSVDVS